MAVTGAQATGRIEAFSDAVFAISATLLVVSLEVPRDFNALKHSLAGFVAFAASFAIFIQIWVHHHRYFRSFPLADMPNIALNSVLLFVVLFFVYPLKFVMLSFTQWITGIGDMVPLSPADLDMLFVIYGLGWIAVFACFAALYWRAHTHYDLLGLDPGERADARIEAELALAFASVGGFSAMFATLGFSRFYGLPGFIYSALGLIGWWFGRNWEQRRAVLVGRFSG